MLKEQFLPTPEELASFTFESPSYTEAPDIRSEHDIWRADILAKRYSQLPSFRHSIRAALTEDIRHLCREDVLREETIEWSDYLKKRGIEGTGYDEPLTSISQNYIAFTAKEFGTVERAVTEDLVIKGTQEWAKATVDQPGEYLIWTSPPSKEYFGITSLDNWDAQEEFCSKINIKWAERSVDPKTGEEAIVIITRQITGWPNIRQLINFWEDINQRPFPNDNPESVITDLIGNLTFFSDPQFTPDEVLSYVSEMFYKSQGEWQHAQEMPRVNPEEFWRYEVVVWNKFYLPKALKLLDKIPAGLTDDDAFWQSEKYEEIIQSMDILFHFFYRHLRNEVDEKKGFKNVNKKITLLEQEYTEDVLIKVHGKKISQQELDKHNTSITNLMSVTNRAISVSQCGLLAPFTAPISAMNAMSHLNGFSVGVGGTSLEFGMYMEKISSVEYQQKLLEYYRIEDGNYQEVNLVVNGETVNYMVPESFLEGKGCFVEVVDGQEIAMGPCDIPLDTVFEDANENIVYKMNALEFDQHKAELYDFLFKNELSKADDLIDKNELLSSPEKKIAKKLLAQLEKAVFKQTIGLTEFVAGIQPISKDAGLYLPGQFLTQLHASRNPLHFLEELVFSTSVFSTSYAV